MVRYFMFFMLCFVLSGCGSENSTNEVIASDGVTGSDTSDIEGESTVRKLALPADTLFQMFPPIIEGYSRTSENSRHIDNIGASQFSTARQQYKGAKGELIDIILTDYNAAPALYEGALSFYFSGMKLEEKGRRMESFEVGEQIIGWSAIDTEQNEYAVFAGYDNRYYLSLNSNSVDDINVLFNLLENFPFENLP